jgi:hypothetical protein
MRVQLKFRGPNSFQAKCVETIIQLKPPLSKEKAVFIRLLKFTFRKINISIDNPKNLL